MFETKTNMNSVLDILKYPNCDPNLKFIYEKIGLDQEYRSRQEDLNVMDMTLLDQVLQMIIDYISLINDCPEAFPLEESQQKEFNGWK